MICQVIGVEENKKNCAWTDIAGFTQIFKMSLERDNRLLRVNNSFAKPHMTTSMLYEKIQ